MADEQPIVRKGLDRGHCTPTPPLPGRPNDRNGRKLVAEEDGRLGHDQVGLEVLSAKGSGIEVRKHQPVCGIGQSRRIASLIMPGLKVRCLDRADTEQDAQHFQIGNPLGQCGIEAGATYLNEPKMEARRVGNGLDVVIGGEVTIVPGDGRKLPFTQTRDGLRERIPEIGLVSTVSCMRLVSRPICWAPVALLLGNVRN